MGSALALALTLGLVVASRAEAATPGPLARMDLGKLRWGMTAGEVRRAYPALRPWAKPDTDNPAPMPGNGLTMPLSRFAGLTVRRTVRMGHTGLYKACLSGVAATPAAETRVIAALAARFDPRAEIGAWRDPGDRQLMMSHSIRRGGVDGDYESITTDRGVAFRLCVVSPKEPLVIIQ
jgi:hypothetical protein